MRHGGKIGWMERGRIFELGGQELGYVEKHSIYDASGKEIGWMKDGYLHGTDGTKISLTIIHEEIQGGELTELERCAVRLLLGD